MSRRFFRNSLLISAALMCIAAAPSPFSLDKEKREPIVVTSQRMEADKLGDLVTFTGDVVLKKEAVTVNSDTLLVHYDPPTKGVREIEAVGNVVVRQEGRVAIGNKAVYYSSEEKIVLTGDAKIIENDNQVGGERITLFLRDNRSVVEGGRVLLYQDRVEDSKLKPRTMKRSGK